MKHYLREKGLFLPKAMDLTEEHFNIFKEMARDLKEKKSLTVDEAFVCMN